MQNLNFIYGTLDLMNETLNKPKFTPYSEELNQFYDKYFPILEQLTDRQMNYLRALCHKKEIEKINLLLKDWEIAYATH